MQPTKTIRSSGSPFLTARPEAAQTARKVPVYIPTKRSTNFRAFEAPAKLGDANNETLQFARGSAEYNQPILQLDEFTSK